jgi:ketosteroid isomerase-like protein
MRLALGSLIAGVPVARAAKRDGSDNAKQIRAVRAQLAEFEGAWNRGDLDVVVRQYHPSIEVLVSAERWSYARTRQYIKELMNKAVRPQLRFDVEFIRPLGRDYALVSGRFHLVSQDSPEDTGPFTAIWMRSPEHWQCIYSHS